jgi:patatin-like phospholipase/acyl hydrolase
MLLINLSIQEETPSGETHQNVMPHDIFDLVTGTSTGGLIAIMLGKLGMTIEECIKTYLELSKEVFGKKHFRGRITHGLAPTKYSGSRLRRCVCRLVRRRGFDEDLPMMSEQNKDQISWSV